MLTKFAKIMKAVSNFKQTIILVKMIIIKINKEYNTSLLSLPYSI